MATLGRDDKNYVYHWDEPRRRVEWFHQLLKIIGRCNPQKMALVTDAQFDELINSIKDSIYQDAAAQAKHMLADDTAREALLAEAKAAAIKAAERLRRDKQHLDKELLPLFQARDADAHCSQKSYRAYQVSFMALAMLATAVGSIQVWALDNQPSLIIVLGLTETVIALMTTYVATIKGNEHPFGAWLANRQRAEQLRREYFRYLTDAEPYTTISGAQRRKMLSLRAATINRGEDPKAIEEDLL